MKINFSNNKVLITGGAGFIGSNLCEELLRLGNKVICLDNFSTGKIENIEREHPKYIVTANIGCLTQLQSGTKTRVLHWAELLEEALN